MKIGWRDRLAFNLDGAAGGSGDPAGAGGTAPGTPGGAGDQPANGAPAPGSGAGAPAPSPWETLSDAELRGSIDAQGFKSIEDLARSQRDLLKLRGVPADKLVKLPDDPSADGAMNEVWNKLGRPAEPSGYNNTLPEGFNAERASAAFEQMHAAGMTSAQAEVAQKLFAEEMAHAAELRQTEAFEQAQALPPADLAAAKQGLRFLGMDAEQVDAALVDLNPAAVLQMAVKVGKALGEDQLQGGGGENSFNATRSVEAVQAEIAARRADEEFSKRWASGGVAEKQAMSKLYQELDAAQKAEAEAATKQGKVYIRR